MHYLSENMSNPNILPFADRGNLFHEVGLTHSWPMVECSLGKLKLWGTSKFWSYDKLHHDVLRHWVGRSCQLILVTAPW